MSGRRRVDTAWLALREPADAAARSRELVQLLGTDLAHVRAARDPAQPLAVHDLGCGTGSMMRWLAPRLPGRQHWVLHDRDGRLLEGIASRPPVRAADQAGVTFETHRGDITRLSRSRLARADLITASALLDLLTRGQLERLVDACVRAERPTLLTLTVSGRVRLDPADPLDPVVTDAFNAHQQRILDGQRLLGPHAVAAAAQAFGRSGLDVTTRASAWRLAPDQATLAGAWLDGWLAAVRAERPDLTTRIRDYAHRRRDQLAAGRLRVTVHHEDLLARPATGRAR